MIWNKKKETTGLPSFYMPPPAREEIKAMEYMLCNARSLDSSGHYEASKLTLQALATYIGQFCEQGNKQELQTDRML